MWDEREERAFLAVLRSGEWGGLSPYVAEIERAFTASHGARHGIAMANGTVSLVAALRAVGIGEGDDVVVPPYILAATATAVVLAGARPVFADVASVPQSALV